MAYAIAQFDATDEAGNLLTNVMVEVRRESGGLQIVYSDREGTQSVGSTFLSADGHVKFFAPGNAYKVTLTKGAYTRVLRFVAVGRASETDLQTVRPRGTYSAVITYDQGDLTRIGSNLFISIIDSNLNNAPNSAGPGDNASWMYAGPAVGVSVEDVLAELGVNSITISPDPPSGGQENDIWFQV